MKKAKAVVNQSAVVIAQTACGMEQEPMEGCIVTAVADAQAQKRAWHHAFMPGGGVRS